MGTLHFKSGEGYRKWLAFGHIHKVFEKTAGHQKIVLRRKPHRVEHTK
jgi:hypothetical protein